MVYQRAGFGDYEERKDGHCGGYGCRWEMLWEGPQDISGVHLLRMARLGLVKTGTRLSGSRTDCYIPEYSECDFLLTQLERDCCLYGRLPVNQEGAARLRRTLQPCPCQG